MFNLPFIALLSLGVEVYNFVFDCVRPHLILKIAPIIIQVFLSYRIFFLSFFRMKKKYYSWEECLGLREVKVSVLTTSSSSLYSLIKSSLVRLLNYLEGFIC